MVTFYNQRCTIRTNKYRKKKNCVQQSDFVTKQYHCSLNKLKFQAKELLVAPVRGTLPVICFKFLGFGGEAKRIQFSWSGNAKMTGTRTAFIAIGGFLLQPTEHILHFYCRLVLLFLAWRNLFLFSHAI